MCLASNTVLILHVKIFSIDYFPKFISLFSVTLSTRFESDYELQVLFSHNQVVCEEEI